MPIPREPLTPASQIPLTHDQRVELRAEIATILDEHRADTSELMRQLVVQRRLYELKARRKTWPWPGAANFIVPIIRFVVDHYKGRIKRVFKMAGNNLWHGTVRGGKEKDAATGYDWKQIAEDAAIVMNHVSTHPGHVNIYRFLDEAIDFIAKDGTCPVKVHYVSRTRPWWTRNEKGKAERFEEPIEERVAWEPIDILRHVWTISGSELEEMPVSGHWIEMTRGQLRAFADHHNLDNADIEKILLTPDNPWFVEEERILDEEMGIRRDTTTGSKLLNIFRIYELMVEFPLKKGEPPAMFVVWYHHATQTILACFDPQDVSFPYFTMRFVKRGRQYLGSGGAEALRVLNLGANAVFNQTVDAQTVANAFGFLYKADGSAANFIAQANIFPGVKIPFDEDPKTEFETFQLGSGSTPVSIGLMNFILQLSEMVGKVSSDLGQVSAGKRVAASVGLQLQQEGSAMIDSVIDGTHETLEPMALRTLVLYANHQPQIFDEILPSDRATTLLTAIRDPNINFPSRVQIGLSISSATASKDRDKQDLIVLANFMFNVFNTITERGMVLTAPQAPPEFKQLVAYTYRGMSEIARRLIEAFDQFKDPDAALPPEILALFEQLAAQPAAQMAPPEAGGVFPRMEGPGAESLAPAATGPTREPAAGPTSLRRNLGGTR